MLVEFYAQTYYSNGTGASVIKKSTFYPKVDQFSRLVMNGCK